VLFLVDASASMMDETVVNVIRSPQHGGDEAPRGREMARTVNTRLVTSQIPAKSQFQVYAFNTQAHSLLRAPTANGIRQTTRTR
jgi:hypothetical protein